VASASISLITRCGIGHPSQPREMLGAELAELAGDRLGRPAGALADRALGLAGLAPLGSKIIEKPASDASPAGRGAVALRRAVERPFALGLRQRSADDGVRRMLVAVARRCQNEASQPRAQDSIAPANWIATSASSRHVVAPTPSLAKSRGICTKTPATWLVRTPRRRNTWRPVAVGRKSRCYSRTSSESFVWRVCV
jgi:hypothetical protein